MKLPLEMDSTSMIMTGMGPWVFALINYVTSATFHSFLAPSFVRPSNMSIIFFLRHSQISISFRWETEILMMFRL